MGQGRLGVYLCGGCDLGERLDLDHLEAVAMEEGGAALCRRHEVLCAAEAVAAIGADLEAGAVDRVAVAACSPRAKTEAFHLGGALVARASLREGVIRVRPDLPGEREATQAMAADALRMACAEARALEQPEPSHEQGLARAVLVVGGGVAGMTAALEAARAGYRAILVEREPDLGGIARRLWRGAPSAAPDPVDPGVEALVAAVRAHPDITLHLGAAVGEIRGAPGRFAADIQPGDGAGLTEHAGAVVQATGMRPYDARRLPELGYGASPDVITQLELEDLARAADGGAIRCPSDGREARRVVFVQCAGQRSTAPGHLPWCSGHCCITSIKQAMYFKDRDPAVEAVVIHDDLRTPGAAGEDFLRAGQDKGVTFRRGRVDMVAAAGGGLAVHLQDAVLDEAERLEADLVVLATGAEPHAGVDAEALPEGGTGAVEIPVESVLKLRYRRGPDLPQLPWGFPDSHFICFPYETRRTGIHAAGAVRRPMDLEQARVDAAGAALKAIQALENAAEGRAAAPRSGDLSYPRVRADGCILCKRCSLECPFGAIDEDELGYPLIHESRCRRCGVCMGVCPTRVISFAGYSVESVGDQIRAASMPPEREGAARILVLACENDALPALDMAAMAGIRHSAAARVLPVRCLGSVHPAWVSGALEGGYDGVVLMGCRRGADYQCHYVTGAEVSHQRRGAIDDALKTLSLDPARVATHEVAITDTRRAAELIDAMADTVARLGLSPYKP